MLSSLLELSLKNLISLLKKRKCLPTYWTKNPEMGNLWFNWN